MVNLDLIAVTQEMTLQAHEMKLYEYLLVEKNYSREDILLQIKKWAELFIGAMKNHKWDGSASYYDEVDNFLNEKWSEMKDGHITRYFNQYEVCWYEEFGVDALNTSTFMYEACSQAENLVVRIWNVTDADTQAECNVSDMIYSLIEDHDKPDFALYGEQHQLVGYAFYDA